MSAIPVPPRDERGELATNRYHVLDNLRAGLLGSCCACGHTCGTWWHDGAHGYHALHERCADRLVEIWASMIEEGIGERPATGRMTGAYARRAAARAQVGGIAPVVTVSPGSIDRGSPFFRPGMTDGSPWVAWGQTVVGRPLAPCGHNEAGARRIVARWRAAEKLGVFEPGGALVLGAVVISPDGALSDGWGAYPVPGQEAPWPSLSQSREWFTCLECGERRWSGCWRSASGSCTACLRASENLGRPDWPVDPSVFGPDPATIKKTAKREKATTLA